MSESFLDSEKLTQFEERKQSHLKLSMDIRNEAIGGSGFDCIELVHESLPELNFDQVSLQSESLNQTLKTPFLISSMTAGHEAGEKLNLMFARQASERGWIFAVGSQRRELTDKHLVDEWISIRKEVPNFTALGNIGIAQLIQTPIDQIKRLIDGLQASGLIVHLNALQEALQLEGTPHFANGLKAIEKLTKDFPVPIIIKETGCGFSAQTLKRINDLGITAVDVGGFGGTHWGRIEGARAENSNDLEKSYLYSTAAKTFADWGISTAESLKNAFSINPNYEVWGSGGVRSGLDAAKILAMGSSKVGFAKPLLQAAIQGEQTLALEMERFEFELKVAMFCTGSKDIESLRTNKVWKWK